MIAHHPAGVTHGIMTDSVRWHRRGNGPAWLRGPRGGKRRTHV